MQDIVTAPFIREIGETASNMVRLGWHERNAGNVSMLLETEEEGRYLDLTRVRRVIPLNVPAPELDGRILAVSGSGKYFKNIASAPADTLGIARITGGGKSAELLWGFEDGGTFTSEITMHLLAHTERLRQDPAHRVVLHAHTPHIIAMTHIHELDGRSFTRSLWKTCTECIVLFSDGCAVIPWMISSSDGIGLASAGSFRDFRIVVWAMHGMTVTGTSLDDAFGLMETVEKAAGIYMSLCGQRELNTLSDGNLRSVAEHFQLPVKVGWLSE